MVRLKIANSCYWTVDGSSNLSSILWALVWHHKCYKCEIQGSAWELAKFKQINWGSLWDSHLVFLLQGSALALSSYCQVRMMVGSLLGLQPPSTTRPCTSCSGQHPEFRKLSLPSSKFQFLLNCPAFVQFVFSFHFVLSFLSRVCNCSSKGSLSIRTWLIIFSVPTSDNARFITSFSWWVVIVFLPWIISYILVIAPQLNDAKPFVLKTSNYNNKIFHICLEIVSLFNSLPLCLLISASFICSLVVFTVTVNCLFQWGQIWYNSKKSTCLFLHCCVTSSVQKSQWSGYNTKELISLMSPDQEEGEISLHLKRGGLNYFKKNYRKSIFIDSWEEKS